MILNLKSSTLGKSFLVSPSQEQIEIDGIASYSKIIEERVLFVLRISRWYLFEGVDPNFSQVNDIKKTLYNGQWIEPDTYQVVVGYGIAQKFSMGLLDFNKQLEILVPKPGKELLQIPQAFNKTDVFP
jgi:lipoprotein-releasing system permease protein